MAFIEKQKKGNKEYYYLTHTVRFGKKFKKARILLTDKKIAKKCIDRLVKDRHKDLQKLLDISKKNVVFFPPKIDKERVKQKYWVWERPCTVHIMHYLAGTLVVPVAKNFGSGYPDIYGIFRHNMGKWIADMKSMIRSGISIINRLLQKDYLNRFKSDWRSVSKKLNKQCGAIDKINLQRMSNKDFLKTYEKFNNALFEWWAFSNIAELISYGGEYLLREAISDEDFPMITAPNEKSYTTIEEEELMRIAHKIRGNKRAFNLFQKNVEEIVRNIYKFKDIYLTLDNHSKKYYWLQNNFFETKILGIGFFVQQIKEILDNNINPVQFIKLNDKRLYAAKKEKEELIKTLDLEDRYIKLIKLLDYFILFQDERKLIALRSSHYVYLYLNEIKRRTGISRNLLNFSRPEEVEKILKNKLEIGVLKKRSGFCVMGVENDGVRILTGECASKLEKRLLGTDNTGNIDEFEGMRGQGGKVIGRVAKILDPRDAKDFCENDILVTTMTSPEFVPLMKKAKAIVTDEGGITCHAAIVAREMNKPCVIATKIATDVLKTGDIVEVNANHGIIKIINR